MINHRRAVAGIAAAVLLPVAIGFQAPQARSAFEVASIKPDSPGGANTGTIRFLPGGRLSAEKAVLGFFIQNAYGFKSYQISGEPGWINSEGYDIEAKAESNASGAKMRLMMQTLLEDRFKLKVHREVKELPVYELAVAKGGPKLQQPKDGSCSTPDPNAPPTPPGPDQLTPCGRVTFTISMPTVRLQGGQVSMPEVARVLSNLLGRDIIDKTGFTGTFDILLEFAWDDALAGIPQFTRPGGPAPAVDSAPSIFSAVPEQLGLRLESGKGPVGVLVIDHVERPSAN